MLFRSFMAAQDGHVDCLKLLLEAGCDLSVPRSNGATPAYMAARNGHTDCLHIIISAGAGVGSPFNGMTPLQAAERGGHSTCADMLRSATSRPTKGAQSGSKRP